MMNFGLLISVGTIICFSFFILMVMRTFSRKQKTFYVQAAHLPFDLPDEYSTGSEQSSSSLPMRGR